MVRRQTGIRILFKTALLWGAVAALGATALITQFSGDAQRHSLVFHDAAPVAADFADSLQTVSYSD